MCKKKIAKFFLTSFFIVTSMVVAAEKPDDALLEGCNSIVDESRRLQCFKAIVSAASVKKGSSEVINEFKKIDALLHSGVSFNEFNGLVFKVKTLVVDLKISSPNDSSLVARFEQAIQAYEDALRFWRSHIEFYARSDNRLAYAGGLPVELTNNEDIISKYGIPTQNSDIFGFHRGARLSVVLSKIGDFARSKYNLTASEEADSDGNVDYPLCTREAVMTMKRNGYTANELTRVCGKN